jgi:uncharacterized protein YbjT (DUF2867 family)
MDAHDVILVTGATGNTGSAFCSSSRERRIRELGIAFTFLRPNLYFQGLLAFKSMIANEGASSRQLAMPASAPSTFATRRKNLHDHGARGREPR